MISFLFRSFPFTFLVKRFMKRSIYADVFMRSICAQIWWHVLYYSCMWISHWFWFLSPETQNWFWFPHIPPSFLFPHFYPTSPTLNYNNGGQRWLDLHVRVQVTALFCIWFFPFCWLHIRRSWMAKMRCRLGVIWRDAWTVKNAERHFYGCRNYGVSDIWFQFSILGVSWKVSLLPIKTLCFTDSMTGTMVQPLII